MGQTFEKMAGKMQAGPPQLTDAQKEAQKYVDDHGIDRLITKTMNSVIAEKPQDAKLFMIRYLAERCSDAELDAGGIQRPGPPKKESLLRAAGNSPGPRSKSP